MLASQLSALCLFFEIIRERGDTPAKLIETTAGEKLKLQFGGGFVPAKPEFSEVDGEFGKQISITARSMDEAKKMLSGIKKKYPYIDETALLNSATQYSVYPKGMVRFDLAFGGELAGSSVVKSALAIACYAGVQVDRCEAALNYLRDNEGSPCFGYYYERDLIVERPTEIPLHCVAVTGNPVTRMLLGYVEYFGIQRMVVCLSKNYSGPALNESYALDPTTGQMLSLSVDLPFIAEDIQAIYDYEKIPDGAVELAYGQVVPSVLQRKFEREKDRVIADAVDFAFKNCGAKGGEIITEEHARKISMLMAQRITPFILHMHNKNPNPFGKND